MSENIKNETIDMVADTAVEVATNGVNVLKERGIGAAIGASAVIVGQLAYKKGIKPGFRKLKDWKAARKAKKADVKIEEK